MTSAAMRPAMVAVSAFGYQPWFTLVVVALGLPWLALKTWRPTVYVWATCAGGGALTEGIKWLVQQPRPVAKLVQIVTPVTGSSFPSGHVATYGFLFGGIAVFAYLALKRSWMR